MENNFAYWLDLQDDIDPNNLKEKLMSMRLSNQIPDIILSTEDDTGIAFLHITNFKEKYDDFLRRTLREVFHELFNIENFPVKIIRSKREDEIIEAKVIIFTKHNPEGKSMENLLGEEVENNQVKSCIKAALEKHFKYLDIIETSIDQIIPEKVEV